jgi:hypothetical protein
MSDYSNPDYTAQIEKASEQYLNTLATAQDNLVKAISAFVKQIPSLPAVPGLPAVDVTAPSKITAASYDFAEKLLAQTRTHTDQVLAALVPATV